MPIVSLHQEEKERKKGKQRKDKERKMTSKEGLIKQLQREDLQVTSFMCDFLAGL